MVDASTLAWQASLFGGEEPSFDASFSGVRRHHLDSRAWVDHGSAWLAGGDEVFARLVREAPWTGREVTMYGRLVDQPRLTAWWSAGEGTPPLLPVVEEMRRALSARYEVDLDSVGLNLYRDGRDSVAWHGDRIARHIVDPIVVIVSVGEPRRFLLRSRQGGPSRAFRLGQGDLLVMGGSSQRTWQHAVPKVAEAGPRISITFRHSR